MEAGDEAHETKVGARYGRSADGPTATARDGSSRVRVEQAEKAGSG